MLKTSKVSDGTKSQDIEREIEKYEQEGVSLKEEADRCEKSASSFKEGIAAKDAVIAEANGNIESLTEEKTEITERLNSLKVEHDAALSDKNRLYYRFAFDSTEKTREEIGSADAAMGRYADIVYPQ